jgi:hypothetical protein
MPPIVRDATAARPADDEGQAPRRDADGRLLAVAAPIDRRQASDDPLGADPELFEGGRRHRGDLLMLSADSGPGDRPGLAASHSFEPLRRVLAEAWRRAIPVARRYLASLSA